MLIYYFVFSYYMQVKALLIVYNSALLKHWMTLSIAMFLNRIGELR